MGFLSNIGTTELLIIAFVLLLLFGSRKMTELARGLGQSSKELKNVKKEYEKAITEDSKPLLENEKSSSEKQPDGKEVA